MRGGDSAARNPHGAWQRFERGELPLFDFYKEFGQDLSDTVNGNVWYAEYCKKRGIREEPAWVSRMQSVSRSKYSLPRASSEAECGRAGGMQRAVPHQLHPKLNIDILLPALWSHDAKEPVIRPVHGRSD